MLAASCCLLAIQLCFFSGNCAAAADDDVKVYSVALRPTYGWRPFLTPCTVMSDRRCYSCCGINKFY